MLEKDNFVLPVIGQILIEEQLLEQSKALEAYQEAKGASFSFLHYLVKNNTLSSDQIAFIASSRFGVPLLDLTCLDSESLPLHLMNEKLILTHQMIPLFCRKNHLFLATGDPSNYNSLKEIQFHTGLNTHAIVVALDKLQELIDYLVSAKEHQKLEYFADAEELENKQTNKFQSLANDAPVVRFVNKILVDAINKDVSDIHFEPYEKTYRIRYRRDGILYEAAVPPANLASRITARIKILSHLDSSEKRIPQDGNFKLNTSSNKSIDCRVSTCPTTNGEKVVIRLLDPSSTKLNIDTLGFNLVQKEQFIRTMHQPQGMILVTGPTGSGKTLTLYSALNRLNTDTVNIVSAEDPVEIKLSGINQVSIQPKLGLTFSTALRAFLRQDPDIIMVGEIRDLETAEIAIKAAQTGHLVLSTLHTNSAAATLDRLINMKVPTFNLASSITLIIAQRLARKLCTYCKLRRNDLHKKELLNLGFTAGDIKEIPLYQAIGCNHCVKGYQGRIGLFEVLPMTKTVSSLILSGGYSADILRQAQFEGMTTLFQSGIEKVKEGITTVEELYRVTRD